MKLLIAESDIHYDEARSLFREYVESLGVDLTFQRFEEELTQISSQYKPPAGAVILAVDDETYAGCVGIRKFEDKIAELKRMYVKPSFRGKGLGELLLKKSIDLAREYGYSYIRLDTLSAMHKAQQLYTAFGFYEIEPYRFNPLKGTRYMEYKL